MKENSRPKSGVSAVAAQKGAKPTSKSPATGNAKNENPKKGGKKQKPSDAMSDDEEESKVDPPPTAGKGKNKRHQSMAL